MKAAVDLEASRCNDAKQIKKKVEEGARHSCFSSMLIQMQEISIHHCWTHFGQSRIQCLLAPNHQNSWRLWSMEDEAKGISQNDEELMKFLWKVLMKILDEFGENGGKVCYKLWELWLWSKFSYD